MGKVKRSLKARGKRFNPYGRPDASSKDGDVKMSGDDSVQEIADKVKSVESRGALEKRHHYEIKMFRKEEKELRRLRAKIKKSSVGGAKEKKELLLEIKQKQEALTERHKKEKEELLQRLEKDSQPE
eukprot:CAMPEP_0203779056 /NCGR_PEP_ID=MMETSP0099_2-20121227/8431_1 /ASSEMBLY_ACC=CAM_ASM_000209 /TAXON_ID=96639 /ORGANISM=" , Strain NY0313808BC1" /LENGTH=126 /DNA_ID=CAMNT_0050678815 /DNA_START=42 /DNA_END=422 /DNA_ORIENTATION=-